MSATRHGAGGSSRSGPVLGVMAGRQHDAFARRRRLAGEVDVARAAG